MENKYEYDAHTTKLCFFSLNIDIKLFLCKKEENVESPSSLFIHLFIRIRY